MVFDFPVIVTKDEVGDGSVWHRLWVLYFRAALLDRGRKLGMYLRRRIRVRQEGERRNIFLRYLGEVADAVSEINRANRKDLYDQLLKIATKKTAEADVKLDSRGRPIEEELDLGKNVLIVDPNEVADQLSAK